MVGDTTQAITNPPPDTFEASTRGGKSGPLPGLGDKNTYKFATEETGSPSLPPKLSGQEPAYGTTPLGATYIRCCFHPGPPGLPGCLGEQALDLLDRVGIHLFLCKAGNQSPTIAADTITGMPPKDPTPARQYGENNTLFFPAGPWSKQENQATGRRGDGATGRRGDGATGRRGDGSSRRALRRCAAPAP
jgi:hypothetical protein